MRGKTEQRQVEHDDDRGSQGGCGAHTKGVGTGQRVVEDCLHFGARQAQAGADHHRHQGIGKTYILDNHPGTGIQCVRVQEAVDNIHQSKHGRAGCHIHQQRH